MIPGGAENPQIILQLTQFSLAGFSKIQGIKMASCNWSHHLDRLVHAKFGAF